MRKSAFGFYFFGGLLCVIGLVNISQIIFGHMLREKLPAQILMLLVGVVLLVVGTRRTNSNRSETKAQPSAPSKNVSIARNTPEKAPSVTQSAMPSVVQKPATAATANRLGTIMVFDEPFVSANYISRMRERFVAFDLETTGLSTVSDRMIEISAAVFEDFQPVRTFTSLVHATVPISPQASRINGITDADIADAPSEAEVMRRFLDFVDPDLLTRGVVLVAHNIKFDAPILARALERSGISGQIEVQDTLALSRRLVPETENHKLKTLADHFGIPLEHAHRATADAIVCGRLYCSLLDRRSVQLHDALYRLTAPEKAACEWVKAAVSSAGIPTDYLTFHSSDYLSVKCGAWTAIKFKFGTRMTFVLVSDQIHIPDGLETAPAVKSEGRGLVRVFFRDLAELEPLIPYFCQRFQNVLDDTLSDASGLKQALEPSYQYVSI